MIEPKFYIAKATKNTNGKFVAGPSVEISTYFKGARYKKADGVENYGKPRTYTETFPESPTPNIFFGSTLETTDLTLTLYFFDVDKHEEETEAISAIDAVYHSFVDYITGTYIKYWDNIRQRKVILAYQEATKPTVDSLYNLIYKEVSFKFINVYGKSFPIDSTEF